MKSDEELREEAVASFGEAMQRIETSGLPVTDNLIRAMAIQMGEESARRDLADEQNQSA